MKRKDITRYTLRTTIRTTKYGERAYWMNFHQAWMAWVEGEDPTPFHQAWMAWGQKLRKASK